MAGGTDCVRVMRGQSESTPPPPSRTILALKRFAFWFAQILRILVLLKLITLYWWYYLFQDNDSISTLSNVSSSEHLCSSFNSPTFGQSISYGTADGLYMTLSGQVYYLPVTAIRPAGLILSMSSLKNPPIAKRIFRKAKRILPDNFADDHLQAMYNFSVEGGSSVIILQTNNCEQMWLVKGRGRYPKLIFNYCRDVWLKEVLKYSLLLDGRARGYVITRDIFTRTNYLILYSLHPITPYYKLPTLPRDTAFPSLTIRHWSMPLNGSINLYTLEKTPNASEVRLVPHYGHLNPNPNSQLLYSLPVGFIKNQRLHLFDAELRCVYLIDRLPAELSTIGESLLLRRKNVPYEVYFGCPVEYPRNTLDNNRCDTTSEVQVFD